jgi:hypothetical protein
MRSVRMSLEMPADLDALPHHRCILLYIRPFNFLRRAD